MSRQQRLRRGIAGTTMMLLLVACGAGGGDGARLSTASQPSPTVPATVPGSAAGDDDKVTPPVDLSITWDGELTPDEAREVRITVTATSATLSDVLLRARGEGVVVVEADEARWAELPADRSVTASAVGTIAGPGEGEVHAEVVAHSGVGDVEWARATDVQVLATDRYVLTGTAGFLLLRQQGLARDLADGVITPAEYERALHALLGGGAEEESSVEPPGD